MTAMKDWKEEARAMEHESSCERDMFGDPAPCTCGVAERRAAALSAAYEQGVETDKRLVAELIEAVKEAKNTLPEYYVEAHERLDRALKSAAKESR